LSFSQTHRRYILDSRLTPNIHTIIKPCLNAEAFSETNSTKFSLNFVNNYQNHSDTNVNLEKDSLQTNFSQFEHQLHHLCPSVVRVFRSHFFNSALHNLLHQRETLLGPLPLSLGSKLQIFSSVLRTVSTEILHQWKHQQDCL